MGRLESDFSARVSEMVSMIPKGRVMTYGQIAALCGNARAARIVGGIAHWGNTELPWHRVVKKDGSLAEGYYGGVSGHERALTEEGIVMVSGKVDIKLYGWHP